MKRNIYMVFDSAAAVYMGPLIYRTDGEALREWEAQATGADNKIGQNPEDFSFYRVGSFNDNDGVLVPEDKICLATAQEMVAKARSVDVVKSNVAKLEEIKVGGTD